MGGFRMTMAHIGLLINIFHILAFVIANWQFSVGIQYANNEGLSMYAFNTYPIHVLIIAFLVKELVMSSCDIRIGWNWRNIERYGTWYSYALDNEEVIDVPRDGKCAYHCVVREIGGGNEDVIPFREKVCEELSEHYKYLFRKSFGLVEEDQKQEFDDLIIAVRTLGEWMDVQVGFVISTVYVVPIMVLTIDATYLFVPQRHTPGETKLPLICTAHVNKQHFVQVKLKTNGPTPIHIPSIDGYHLENNKNDSWKATVVAEGLLSLLQDKRIVATRANDIGPDLSDEDNRIMEDQANDLSEGSREKLHISNGDKLGAKDLSDGNHREKLDISKVDISKGDKLVANDLSDDNDGDKLGAKDEMKMEGDREERQEMMKLGANNEMEGWLPQQPQHPQRPQRRRNSTAERPPARSLSTRIKNKPKKFCFKKNELETKTNRCESTHTKKFVRVERSGKILLVLQWLHCKRGEV